jgi:asparagine synthase (glutamine-hydrolysing)
LGTTVEGITVAFDEFSGGASNEVPTAANVAAHYGLRHHVRRVTKEEFGQDLPGILDAMDQPSVDGVNTWFASKAAAENGFKVALCGLGADELFLGYSLFQDIPRTAAVGRAIAAIPAARSLLPVVCLALARLTKRPKFIGVPIYMDSVEGAYFLRRGLFLPSELPGILGPESAREGLERLAASDVGTKTLTTMNDAAAVGILESTRYLRNQLLRDSDWASMAHSLELRTPFVDAVLLETLAPYASAFAKGAGKSMIAHGPRQPLPEQVVARQKTGFSVPMEQWLTAVSWNGTSKTSPTISGGTHWSRRWARTVMAAMPGCD